MKIKRDKRDAIFSLLVRERACWRCERCGKQFERGAQNLHCSHLFGRRHRTTRWHPSAAVSHCAACHFYLTEHPIGFAEWVKNYLGEKRMNQMRLLSQAAAKFSKKDLESIYRFMKTQHKGMMAWRTGARLNSASAKITIEPAPEIAALEDSIRVKP